MAVAFDAASESHAGTTGSVSVASFNWTHTPVGTPKGVLVYTFVGPGSSSDLATAVDYGGTNVPAVSGGRAVDTAGEPGDCKAWFLGSSVPTGAQTVTVTRTNNAATVYAIAFTVTAAGDTEVYTAGIVLEQTDGTLAEESVDDGSPGTNSQRFGAVNSGLAAVPAAGAATTAGPSIDYGTRVVASGYETTPGQGSRSVGFSDATSDDRAGVYLAVREPPAVGGSTVKQLAALGVG